MILNTLQLKRAVSAVLLVLLLSAFGMTKAFAISFTVGDLNYSVNSDGTTVTVTGHVDGTAATGELVIPETVTYNGSTYSVTAIGNSAFYNCTGLTGDLVIPNSVTTIGENAFASCTGFSSVEYDVTDCAVPDYSFAPFDGCGGTLIIGENVERIPDYMFHWAAFTGSLIIPNSVTYIGDAAFEGCTGFTGNLVIPNSVTTIGYGAFVYCTGFTGNLVISNSVTYIDDETFRDCSGFTGQLLIPNSVTYIGDGAFEGTGFTGNLTIGNSVTYIGQAAFYDCSGFSSVEYNATNCADAPSEYYGAPPFHGCGGTLTIGENVERIPARMFREAMFTGDLIIPNSVTCIGEEAFYDCSGLTDNLSIGSSVTYIGKAAFYDCSGFSSVEYNVTNCADVPYEYYGAPPFDGCSGTLTISENVERIPAHMFRRANFTGDLVIPNSVTYIGFAAFNGCRNFTGNLTIPNSVTYIGGAAFNGCTGFSSVEYNATACADADSSYWSTFKYCGGQLIIGENVERIPAYMFSNTAFIQILSHAEMPPTVGNNAFYGIDHDIPVYVPCGSMSDYKNAEGWNEFNNIFECFNKEITVTVTPANSGTVTGAGTYEMGTTCTLTATPNTGYEFTNWTENGTEVSTNVSYTFTVTENRNLVANFTSISGGYHWTVNPNQYSNTMTAIAVIQIDGVEQMVNTLEVGAFCGDECRGRELPVYIEQMNRYYLFLTMYGTEGDQLTFRLYDHVLDQEFDGTCSNVEYFVTNGTLGSPVSPYIFEFVSVPVSYTITASANPTEGGSVSGGGTYQSGSTCTLTATANTGYNFTNWTKNGTVVSNNPTYSFTVTEDVDLVANFEAEVDLPGDPNGDGTVNTLDIVIIVNYIFGETPEEFFFDNADVNGDGVVNALDLVAIINLIFSKYRW